MLENIIPLPHAVRVSPRAKYIRFRILAGTGLEVVVPRDCPASRVRKAAATGKKWIDRHQLEIERAAGMSPDVQHLPEHIVLPAQDKTYTVCYDAHAGQPHFVHTPEQDQVLVLADPRMQADVCCRLLQKWLKDQAREALVPRAFSLSTEHKLPIARVQIRKQKTRWASMSTTGTLSLNCHLMFLGSELVQHVLLHELCHVRHPNHGPGFQALLSCLSPARNRYERAMKYFHKTAVPWWARF